MVLNVKARIAIAMTIVLAVNIFAGTASWWLNAQAAELAAEARAATARAKWVSGLSEAVTTFVSEANDLAFGLGSDLSTEGSAEYGDVTGVDQEIKHRIGAAPEGVEAKQLDEIAAAWKLLRTDVFVWVNAEAEAASWPTRLKLMADDQVRASVDTNIDVPLTLKGMSAGEMRRAVRQEYEAFRDRRLLAVMRQAEAQAVAAQVGEARAREMATTVTIALFALSALIAGAAAVWLYRTIATPLNRARLVADAVAGGDLEVAFEPTLDDEIGSLVHAVEAMRDTVVSRIMIMREMAGAVLVTSAGVTTSVREAAAVAGEQSTPEIASALADAQDRAQVLETLAGQMLEG